MSEEYEKLLKSVEELKVKIPSLLDLIDEVIAHESRFKSIDEKTDLVIGQLKNLRNTLETIQVDNKTLKTLVKDDNNISVAILLFEKILDRKDIEIKKYMNDCFCTEETAKFIGKAVFDKKKELVKLVWESLEEKLQLYIGKRVLAGTVSGGLILGVLFMIVFFIMKYIGD